MPRFSVWVAAWAESDRQQMMASSFFMVGWVHRRREILLKIGGVGDELGFIAG